VSHWEAVTRLLILTTVAYSFYSTTCYYLFMLLHPCCHHSIHRFLSGFLIQCFTCKEGSRHIANGSGMRNRRNICWNWKLRYCAKLSACPWSPTSGYVLQMNLESDLEVIRLENSIHLLRIRDSISSHFSGLNLENTVVGFMAIFRPRCHGHSEISRAKLE
jgi:hypothetical protein